MHNGDRFLAEAICSVLSQSLSAIEFIIIDDGSTDATPRILAHYAQLDTRIRVLSQPNQGRTASLNSGFALATGPLIARLDADDVAIVGRLEMQRSFLDEHEDVALLGGAAVFVDQFGNSFGGASFPTSDGEIRRALRHTTPFVHSAVMLRKAAFDDVGGYRPVFTEAEDLDLWIRIAERYTVANLPDELVRYRFHSSQATVLHLERQAVSALAARLSAEARARRDPDPLEGMPTIDRAGIVAAGVPEAEISATFVHMATWVGKEMSRAGEPRIAAELFRAAAAEARLAGAKDLLAHVHRVRAQVHDERGDWFSARLETARATLAAGASPTFGHRRSRRGRRRG